MLARVSQASREVVDFLIRGIKGAEMDSSRAPKSSMFWWIQKRKFGFGVSLSMKQVVVGGQG